MKRFLWLGAVLVVFTICSGCGDVFRPIIIPNPQQFPNPAAAHTVVTISDNANVQAGKETPQNGSAMVIDVSGDTDESQANVGLRPVHAVQQTASTVLVVNQSITGVPSDSLTKLVFSGVTIQSTNTISLPVGSAPNFVATTENSQAYVSMPKYVDPVTSLLTPSVAVVNTVANSLVATIPVGSNPFAIAETPNGQKLYVANQGDNTVNAFNSIDRSPRTITNGSFSSPIWISARNDSQRVYVLNGTTGVVSTIDTTTTSGPDNVIDNSITVPGATYMWYDTILNRLYIPGGGQVTIVDVSQSIPSVMGGGPFTISTVSPASRAAGDPCASTGVGTLSVTSATSLPDGSRAYVGAYYLDGAGNVCPQVTVINATSLTVKTATAVPGFPDATIPSSPYYVPVCTSTRFRFNMAAGGDSKRAYLSSCDGGNVNIIDTTTDTYDLNLLAPNSARAPIPPSTQNPPQSPVFMIAGP
jgi:DNA-binding beta-propeller fold protein YncE